jgi:hypothetical protein
MNKKQKKLFSAYIVFICLIILFFFIIIRFAIYQKHISTYGDILHEAVFKEEVIWIKLAIIALVSLFVISSIIFVGFLIFLKRKNNS